MIEKDHPQLSVRKQAQMLAVNRNRLEPPAPPTSPGDAEVKLELDKLHMQHPSYGYRRLQCLLDEPVGSYRLRRLMREMGIYGMSPGPQTSRRHPKHPVYPYLLRKLNISRPNQVWCADITYIPMPHGNAYLVAIMDWHTRAVLAWRISSTLDAAFCVEAFREAVEKCGCVPEIFNTDQGSQFTSSSWINELKKHEGLRISMDGRGCWTDNVFIERLWFSIKYEDIYLKSYGNLRELHYGVEAWMHHYNHERPHQALGYQTPWSKYQAGAEQCAA